jgi:hypothetical protein
VLWRFSDAVGTYPLLNCHVEYDSRIIATTPDGVFLLERQAPCRILKRDLDPTAVARLSADGEIGYALDANGKLVAFSPSAGIIWTRKPRKGQCFQNPFPLNDGSVCISTTKEVSRLDRSGQKLWSWAGIARHTPHANERSRYAIAAYVEPDLLLVRSVEKTMTTHLSLHAQEGSYLHTLGDVWPYGADGVKQHPVALFDHNARQISFLQADGSCLASQPLHSFWRRKFCNLPEQYAALFYDSWLRAIVCADSSGKICWRQSYPDAENDFAAMSFTAHTAFFVTTAGNLHIWDWFDENFDSGIEHPFMVA